jgi:hypothetical protein
MKTMIAHKRIATAGFTFGLMALAPMQAGAQGAAPSSSAAQNRSSATWLISRPGNYTLTRNIGGRDGDAILIRASNVNLDLNGFSVLAAEPGKGRGIVVEDAKGVTIRNGQVEGFNMNVVISGCENTAISDLQITGEGLAPAGGPSEIGIMIVNGRATTIRENTISSVNLGIFVRGGGSTGNLIEKNVVVGGPVNGSNLLGICYNPAAGAGPEGPSGDSIYNNHIARFNYAISVSDGSRANLFIDNTLSSFTGPFRELSVFEAQGGTNAEFDNASTIIPSTPAAP